MSNTLRMSNTLPRTSLRGSYSAERCHLCRTVGISTSKAGVFQISPHDHHTTHERSTRARRRFVRAVPIRCVGIRNVPIRTRHTVYPSCRGTPRGQKRSRAPRPLRHCAARRFVVGRAAARPARDPGRTRSWPRIRSHRQSACQSRGHPACNAEPRAILHATRAPGHPAYNASPRLSCMHTTHCRVPRRLSLASDDL